MVWVWHLRHDADARQLDHMHLRQQAKIDLLEQAEILTETSAGEWRSRFSRLQRPGWPRREIRARRERANAVMEELVRGLATHDDLRRRAQFSGALLAFHGSALFSRHQALQWQNRIRMFGTAAPEPPKRLAPYDETQLERTIDVPATRVAGLRITGADLFNGGLALAYDYDPAYARPRDRLPLYALAEWWLNVPDVHVSDSVGTRYYAHGAFSMSHGFELDERAYGRITFRPAVPEDARALTIRAGRDKLTVKLSA
jgi:hypothetical protein